MTEVLKEEQSDCRTVMNRAAGDQAREVGLNHIRLRLSIMVENWEFKLRVVVSLRQFK